MQAITSFDLHPFNFHGYTGKRKVASFGYDYSFEHKKLSKGMAIPAIFQPLLNKVAAQINIQPIAFAELLITEYPPGSVINWHRDAPPFELIAGISLAGDCIFRLKPYAQDPSKKQRIIPVRVERRSLYILKGAVRADWLHSTMPVKATRYSITLRTLR